jgi:large subunit ribosomal protein L15
MFELNSLTKSSTKTRKRVGRGGSRGGTSGRGHKGQKARTGHSKAPARFEGGQMPLVRRLPKRGFNNTRFATDTQIINLQDLERGFSSGDKVTKEILLERGMIKGQHKAMLKILGYGPLSKKLFIIADAASKNAIEAIKSAGGEIQLNKEM